MKKMRIIKKVICLLLLLCVLVSLTSCAETYSYEPITAASPGGIIYNGQRYVMKDVLTSVWFLSPKDMNGYHCVGILSSYGGFKRDLLYAPDDESSIWLFTMSFGDVRIVLQREDSEPPPPLSTEYSLFKVGETVILSAENGKMLSMYDFLETETITVPQYETRYEYVCQLIGTQAEIAYLNYRFPVVDYQGNLYLIEFLPDSDIENLHLIKDCWKEILLSA